jgi:hypothetical protein
MISTDNQGTHLTQRALYQPRGLAGRAYWYALAPFHGRIFSSMAKALANDIAMPSSATTHRR